ncbi:oligoendopeptidase F [Patescibacteria group bacterium]|nr:oligoendopeptidase F [Patescibacteria group bacterium]
MDIERKDVPACDRWDIESLYADDEAWNADYEKVLQLCETLQGYKGELDNPETILECLKLHSSIEQTFERLFNFAIRKEDEDTADGVSGKRAGKARELLSKLNTAAAFIGPELSEQPDEFLRQLSLEPDFADYSFSLNKLLRGKNHLLPTEQEELLAKFSETLGIPQLIAEKLRDADMKFPTIVVDGKKVEVSNSNFGVLRQHTNRSVRRLAVEKFFGTYKNFRTTLASALTAHVRCNVTEARARKYQSIMDIFLHSKGLDSSVYKTLFQVANEHLPLLHRYCDIRRRKLGLQQLAWHDLYVPIVDSAKNTFGYNEAVALTLSAVEPLGKEYVEILRKGLTNERWVDRIPNKGKRGGAYSVPNYGGKQFILMNYKDRLEDVSTLVHEAGHSMHSYLAIQSQPFPTYDYEIFVAEIASTLNEILLSEYMLRGADDTLRAFIINDQLEGVRTTFFRQVMFAEFEAMLYERMWNGEQLSADDLEEAYFAINQRYYGPDIMVNDVIRHEWSLIPHFYYNFYVYQYATGLSCAAFFSEQILSGKPGALESYMGLLHAGGSDYPAVLLKNAGLDVSKPDYLLALMKKFKEWLDAFDALLPDKI